VRRGVAEAPGSAGDHAAALALTEIASLPADMRATVLGRLLHSPTTDVREPALRMGAEVLTTDQLVTFLREAADDTLRNAAAEMLKARGRHGVPLAIELLNDRDAGVVLQAVLVLDHVRDPRALEPLRATLHHTNLNVVQAAIIAIGHLGNRAMVQDLLPFLRRDPWVQMAAIEALGDLRAPEAISALAALLDDAFLGPVAADAVARIGSEEALRLLGQGVVAAAEVDPAAVERLAHVAEGLAATPRPIPGLPERLLTLLGAGTEAARAAARCLLAFGPGEADAAALAELVRGWQDHSTLPACLRQRHDLIGPLLTFADRRRGWGFRLAALYPARAPLDALATALSNSSLDHLDAVAEALLAVGDDRVGPWIVAFFARLPEDVRSAWGPLLRRHRSAILQALGGESPIPSTVASVLAVAIEQDPERAALALERMEPAARREALHYVSDWPAVLKRLPWLDWLAQDPDAYGAYAVAVADIADLRGLLHRLRDQAQEHPHRELLRLLGRLRDHHSLPFLALVARAGRPDLRPYALGALGAIGGPEACRILRDVAAGGAPYDRYAYRALAECCTAQDLTAFRDAAANEDWHVRMTAADALGRAGEPQDLAVLGRLAADPVAAVADRARAHLAVG
jgi:HEAT repeat protein